jgi:hypothetical protein
MSHFFHGLGGKPAGDAEKPLLSMSADIPSKDRRRHFLANLFDMASKTCSFHFSFPGVKVAELKEIKSPSTRGNCASVSHRDSKLPVLHGCRQSIQSTDQWVSIMVSHGAHLT